MTGKRSISNALNSYFLKTLKLAKASRDLKLISALSACQISKDYLDMSNI